MSVNQRTWQERAARDTYPTMKTATSKVITDRFNGVSHFTYVFLPQHHTTPLSAVNAPKTN